MRKITIIIAICLLALMAVPAITPVGSIGNSAIAEGDGPCPGCWAFKCDDEYIESRCIIACLPTPQNGDYWFWAEVVTWVPDPDPPYYLYPVKWCVKAIMTIGSDRCGEGCIEYASKRDFPYGEADDWTGNWWVTDGDDFQYIICDGAYYEDWPPIWAQ